MRADEWITKQKNGVKTDETVGERQKYNIISSKESVLNIK